MPTFTGISHIEISVVDLDASVKWYCTVLGLRKVGHDDYADRHEVLLKHDPTGLFIGISEHTGRSLDRFDEREPGLDHIGFAVEHRSDLDELERRLTELGVTHSPVTDQPSGVGTALVFRDPDNVQLEFWWSRPH